MSLLSTANKLLLTIPYTNYKNFVGHPLHMLQMSTTSASILISKFISTTGYRNEESWKEFLQIDCASDTSDPYSSNLQAFLSQEI